MRIGLFVLGIAAGAITVFPFAARPAQVVETERGRVMILEQPDIERLGRIMQEYEKRLQELTEKLAIGGCA